MTYIERESAARCQARCAFLNQLCEALTSVANSNPEQSEGAVRTEGEIDEENLDLPCVPEDADIVELPAMRVADVRGCVVSIAARIGEDPDELLEAATV
jgi:hypothetical protein